MPCSSQLEPAAVPGTYRFVWCRGPARQMPADPVVNEEIEAQVGYMASLRPTNESQARVQGHSFLSRKTAISSFVAGGGSKCRGRWSAVPPWSLTGIWDRLQSHA